MSWRDPNFDANANLIVHCCQTPKDFTFHGHASSGWNQGAGRWTWSNAKNNRKNSSTDFASGLWIGLSSGRSAIFCFHKTWFHALQKNINLLPTLPQISRDRQKFQLGMKNKLWLFFFLILFLFLDFRFVSVLLFTLCLISFHLFTL